MDHKQFLPQLLRRPIRIKSIVSVFYSDLGSDFISRGETHDFWEFVYVDRGHLHVETDDRSYPLAQGEITFHKPMEFHRHIAGSIPDTSLCVAAFYCDSPALSALTRRTFVLDDAQRRTLSQSLKYATDIFSSLVDTRDSLYLVKKENINEIQEQLFINHLESFLLQCIIRAAKQAFSPPSDAMTISRTEHLGQRTVDYLAQHLTESLTIPQICAALGCSKTTLSTSFHAYTGSSIIPYFNRLKIEAAKNMIRFDDFTLTQISERLNFCNLNYFSTAFKRYTGMHPREYAKSLKVHNGVYLVNPEHDAIIQHEGIAELID